MAPIGAPCETAPLKMRDSRLRDIDRPAEVTPRLERKTKDIPRTASGERVSERERRIRTFFAGASEGFREALLEVVAEERVEHRVYCGVRVRQASTQEEHCHLQGETSQTQ